jgi:hypothetical protein
MSERYALPRRESVWDMATEDRARIEAINARLKLLVDGPISRPVTVTYWGSADRPIERLTFASQFLPSATGLMPAVYGDSSWASQATHITIEEAP